MKLRSSGKVCDPALLELLKSITKSAPALRDAMLDLLVDRYGEDEIMFALLQNEDNYWATRTDLTPREAADLALAQLEAMGSNQN